MTECERCINGTYCTSCSATAKYLKEDYSGCVASCTITNYADNHCVNDCYVDDNERLKQDGVCVNECSNGYYLLGTECLACAVLNCKTCIDGTTTCVLCNTGFILA